MSYTKVANLDGEGYREDAIRRADGAVFFADARSAPWQAFEAWLAEGNTPAEPPAPEPVAEPVPERVTNADWRVALIRSGRFGSVEACVLAARDGGSIDGAIAWQRWEYANHVYRAELTEGAAALGLSPEAIDETLLAAAAIAAARTAKAA